jgi:hypothetical protein
MKIKTEDKEIELVEVWFKYLYSYLIRFCISNNLGIEWKNDIIFISKENQPKFKIMLEESLQHLLSDCYREPTQKERTKNSSRYQKIDFKGVTYFLNYRTDIIGIIGYALDYLIKETKPIKE